ncbi:DEAD/DEAH box helicase family protein [Desulforamulus ruminis]|uniref:DEAD/DEAH box helicase n=1 Tax=Desulforamulus ruminis TaxID=1564 RepID=UPI002FDAE13D
MSFHLNYFSLVRPSILDNENLREPQKLAYMDLYRHFLEQKSTRDAVVILPTGAGKTGVIALSPYRISEGRVLIITPQLVIKDHVLESLDPTEPENFWLKRKVFPSYEYLPNVTEYDKDTHLEELEQSNIVILNIHKLSMKYRNSLLTKVNNEFFDMIIIDEAHHSPADTWQNALNYFSRAKVIKLTGTPFRADRKPIEGRVVTNYRLGRAMTDKIVKTLENFKLIQEKLYLTIDNNPNKRFTIEQIRSQGIKDEDFINRSVALSQECNRQIIIESINALNKKRLGTDVPHKIIGVACSIEHANQIKDLYQEYKLRAEIIHSKMDKDARKEVLINIENHRCDVIIHVAMLGEGYDHPYLSIAAIFRPFRSLAPYSQFIGRILRCIPDNEARKPSDNIGTVIAHRDLGLDGLWKEYQNEDKISKIIETVKAQEKEERKLEHHLSDKYKKDIAEIEIGGEIIIESEYYDLTDLVKENEIYEQELNKKIVAFKEMLPNSNEEEIRKFILTQNKPQNTNPLLKNIKKYRIMVRDNFNRKIHQDIPAELITEFNVEKEGRDFANLRLTKDYRWITNNDQYDNAAIIAVLLNSIMKNTFGSRDKWNLQDYFRAEEYLEKVVDQLRTMLKSSLRKR